MYIEYRLPDGHIISRNIDIARGITTEDIDILACQYFEHTGMVPDRVFIRHDLYFEYIKACVRTLPGMPTGHGANMGVTMWLSVGQVPLVPKLNAYIPLLVGTEQDFYDNDLSKVFEEVVLKGCERES